MSKCINCGQFVSTTDADENTIVDVGPFCNACYETLRQGASENNTLEIEELKATIGKLREDLANEGVLRAAAETQVKQLKEKLKEAMENTKFVLRNTTCGNLNCRHQTNQVNHDYCNIHKKAYAAIDATRGK